LHARVVENRQLLGELEGIDLLLQQLSVSDDMLLSTATTFTLTKSP